jgi:membrane-associated phospholipid phosphatase
MRRIVIKLRSALLAGLAAVSSSGVAAAQNPVRFDARLLPSGAVLAATAAVAVAPVLFAAHLPHATCAPCDPSGLPFLDRGTVGAIRAFPATASDAALFATGAGAGLFLLGDARGEGAMAREDITVLAQAVGTASALTNWSKVVFHRPRPYRYVAGAAGSGGAAASGLSFPSGHTSAAFAAAFAYWSIQARRGRAGDHRQRIAALVLAATATGVLRVAAREHFPTDVVAGAVLGAAAGWAVPRLYPLRR